MIDTEATDSDVYIAVDYGATLRDCRSYSARAGLSTRAKRSVFDGRRYTAYGTGPVICNSGCNLIAKIIKSFNTDCGSRTNRHR